MATQFQTTLEKPAGTALTHVERPPQGKSDGHCGAVTV